MYTKIHPFHKKLDPPKENINLHKVANLLADPHSEMLFDRHVHAMKKVIKHYEDGFHMKDLVTVFKILNVCADRVHIQSLYIEPMCAILKLCSIPFLKEKTSDATAFKQIATESVSQLGYLMRVPSNRVRLQICRSLATFYSEEQTETNHDPYTLQSCKLDYNQKIVEASDVGETLVKSLALLGNDLQTKIAVLGILLKLSKNSERNCTLMLQASAAERLCQTMLDPDPTGLVLFYSVDCLWNLLENTPNNGVAVQLSTLESIKQLQDAFILQLSQGYSHYDRQLRNDLLVIASLIASITEKSHFIESGFVRQLTALATFQEVKCHHVLVRHLKLMKNAEDFELKKLLMNILVVLSRDSATIPIYSEAQLLRVLFTYVTVNEKTRNIHDWKPAQFEELQLQAMASLCTLGPLMIEDYMMCQGTPSLLLLLEWCLCSDDYSGHGNSFHGAGGRGTKRAQMRYCLHIIHNMVATREELVLRDFMEHGAIKQITAILNGMCGLLLDDGIDIEMQSDMLIILSVLCEGDIKRKELFGKEGADMCIEYLRTDAKKLTSGLGHHRLLLAAVDCIWCAVIGCYVTEDYFLENEGVFLLIDLLETCPKNMHNLILGCLLDLCENPKTVGHINVWRGTKDMSAAHLFCELWRQEEATLGVQRETSGAISDLRFPLMGQMQEQLGIIPLPATCPSQAIVDVSENLRAKIYALFGKIGFIELPGLTTKDHVTLTIVEHYFDFKLGEVWIEVIEELQEEGVRPISPDCEALDAISRTVTDRTHHVVQAQKELLEAQTQQDLIDEQERYAEIRENHRQREKAISDFNSYVVRTSNYALLRAAHEKQERSIDASRLQTNYKSSKSFHDVDSKNLTVTTFSSRHLFVDSTPPELTGGKLAKYDPKKGRLLKRSYYKPNIELVST